MANLTVNDLVKVAAPEVGYHESGDNCTKYGQAYGAHCLAWCAVWIWWIFWRAGASHLLPLKTASAAALASGFQRQRRWGHTPAVGALVFYHMPGGHAGINHVEFVYNYGPGWIETMGGNTSNRVSRVRRSTAHYIVGYGYPAYGKSSKPTTPQEAAAMSKYIDPKLAMGPSGKRMWIEPSGSHFHGRTAFFAVDSKGGIYTFNEKNGFDFKSSIGKYGDKSNAPIIGFEVGYIRDTTHFQIVLFAEDGGTFGPYSSH